MRKMRTVKESWLYLLSQDEKCRMTRFGIRMLCQQGKIYSVQVGRMLLLDLDELVKFLCG